MLPGAGVMPTPNAKAPLSTWPSTADTERQLIVYTPLARPLDSLDCSSSGLPGTASTGDTPGTVRPFESRIRTSVSLGSGFSPKVITIVAGDCRREEPADGTELTRLAWARAAATGPARRTPTASARAASSRGAVLGIDLRVIPSQQVHDDEHDDPDGVHEVPVVRARVDHP